MGRLRVLVLVVVLTTATAACDWAQFGADAAHTSSNGDTALTTANVSGLAPDWTSANQEPFRPTAPVVAKGSLFVTFTPPASGSTPRLYAYSAAGSAGCTGARVCDRIWQANGYTGSPAVEGGHVFALGGTPGTATLNAFDAAGVANCGGAPKTCAPVWSASWTGAGNWSPVTADGRVYVATGGVVRVFDAAGVTDCSAGICAPMFVLAGAGNGFPSVANGLLFFPGPTGVDVFDATGRTCGGFGVCAPRFRLATGAAAGVPVVSAGHVFLYAGNALEVFDAAGVAGCSGSPVVCSPRWTSTFSKPPKNNPTVTATTVFVASGDASGASTVSAIDAAGSARCSGSPKTCLPLWQATLPDTLVTGQIVASASLTFVPGQSVAFGIAEVLAFDALGRAGCSGTPGACSPVWSTLGPAATSARGLAVANGRLYRSVLGAGIVAFAIPA